MPQRSPSFLRPDYRLRHAIYQVYSDTGRDIWVKPKALTKFGRNDDHDNDATFETVWQRGGHETLISTNGIDTISSSNAGDDQTVTIEGHTISGTDLTFSVQTATLDGQNKVTLATPLARTTRMYNTGTTDFAGTIYVYEDDTVLLGVPQTAANIHLQTSGSNNQSLKCSTSISSTDYWLITQVGIMANRQGSTSIDGRLQLAEVGKVWRTRFPISAGSNGETFSTIQLDPVLIVPPNHDVRMIAASSANNASVGAFIGGYLCNWNN